MLKTVSVGGLLLLSAMTPLASFAKESPHLSGRAQAMVHQEVKKLSADVQVSLMGKVTGLNGMMLTVLGNNASTYTVDANAAKVERRYSGAMAVADIQLNDQVFVQGALTGAAIKAKTIQDFSLQARNGAFSGAVQSVAANSFVLKSPNRGAQTIFVSSATKFVKNGATATLADVLVGSTVKVDGVWNNTNNNVTASKVQIVAKQEQVRLNGIVSRVDGAVLVMAGTDGKTYTVNAAEATVATSAFYGKGLTNIHVGDRVQVWGKAMTGSTEVKANMVINFSS